MCVKNNAWPAAGIKYANEIAGIRLNRLAVRFRSQVLQICFQERGQARFTIFRIGLRLVKGINAGDGHQLAEQLDGVLFHAFMAGQGKTHGLLFA